MQIFRKKPVILALLCGFLNWLSFGQSMEMPQMPSMPEISGGAEVSMPTIGSSFYRPNVPNANRASASSAASASTSADSDGTQNDSSQTAASSLAALTTSSASDDWLSALLGNNSTLTASDISSLYDSGLFTNVSSLGTGLTSSLYSGYSQDTTTNLLLQQILTNLNQMKAEQNNATATQKEQLNSTQLDLQTFKSREPSILRFKINGYDVKDSLQTVFFSEPETDGTFLLTADRTYFADNKNRTETFYILFKAVKTQGTSVTYQVEPSLVQDYKNENSLVYKLSGLQNLTAQKTGNMVVLHSNEGVTVDLLVNIDKN